MTQLSKVSDYKNILFGTFESKTGEKISVKTHGDEHAYVHLKGEPYLYSDLLERVMKYLQNHDGVYENDLYRQAEKNHYPHDVIRSTLTRLKGLAHIGFVKGRFKWYPLGPDDELRQKALDEAF